MSKLNISQNSRMLRLGLALTFGLVLLIGLLLAMGAAHPPDVALAQGPNTRHVNCASGSDSGGCTAPPCQTIGYALSQANNGDTIRVTACTYTESLTLDKPVSLMGEGADVTIIHALAGQRVMTITGATITNSTVISGFTFTGGNPVADVGGGLLVITSAPTIRNNYFISNTTVMSYNGGGLYFQNSNGLLLSDNLISGNRTITGCGGGLYFDNSANATLTGNTISNNKASPFPSAGIGGSGGGALFDNSPEATLSDNVVSDNRASWGGGLKFSNSPTATLMANTISDNVGNHMGWGMKGYGGVLFYRSNNATLIGNTISGNRAPNWCAGVCFLSSDNAALIGNAVISNTKVQLSFDGWGVGVYFHASKDARLVDNVIRNNTGQDIDLTGAANILGGGLYIGRNCTVSLISNTISSNGATRGGGLYAAPNSTVVLVSNWITGNVVYDFYGYDPVGYGGGLYLSDCFATLTNTVIADNQTDTGGHGSGLYIAGSSPRLLHTTIARNSGGDGSGVYITGTDRTVALTNTILVSHTVGITVTASNTAILNGVLWYSNTINYGGLGTITVTNEYTGNPAFAADGYHLTSVSAAIDKGVNAGVTTDIDDNPRDSSPDLGADEFAYPIYLPVILKSSG
jgi:parallel beta-helix repeat protein